MGSADAEIAGIGACVHPGVRAIEADARTVRRFSDVRGIAHQRTVVAVTGMIENRSASDLVEHPVTLHVRVGDRNIRNRREAPDVALPGAGRVGVVDLVDSPVIGRADLQPVRKWKTGETYNLGNAPCVADECALGAVVDVVEVRAEIHIVRDGKASRFPAQIGPVQPRV